MANIAPPSTLDKPDALKTPKAFIPLESNPRTINPLVYKLGLSEQLAFHDVAGLDPEFLGFFPHLRPAAALLFVFPISKPYEDFKSAEDEARQGYEGRGEQEPVIWYKQTIPNACGMIGLLHALSNGPARSHINPGSLVDRLVKDAAPLGPAERAELLDCDEIRNLHQNAASQGQSAVPDAAADTDLHYVCFVKDAKNRLWEMDGRRKGPLDRGQLGEDDDVLCEKAIEMGPKKFMDRELAVNPGYMNFSLLALAPSLPEDDDE